LNPICYKNAELIKEYDLLLPPIFKTVHTMDTLQSHKAIGRGSMNGREVVGPVIMTTWQM